MLKTGMVSIWFLFPAWLLHIEGEGAKGEWQGSERVRLSKAAAVLKSSATVFDFA
jgi:hypothetical protein